MEEPRRLRRKRPPRVRAIEPLRINPKEPLPQPDIMPPRAPRLLSEPVLGCIERAAERIRAAEDLPLSGKALRASLRGRLTEFEAAARLVPRALARDPAAVRDFRSWLSRAARHPRRARFAGAPPRGPNRVPGIPFGAFACLETFRELFYVAVLAARSKDDFLQLRRGIDAMFVQARWAESLYQATIDLERTGDPHSLAARVRLYGRGPGRRRGTGLPGGRHLPGEPGGWPPGGEEDWRLPPDGWGPGDDEEIPHLPEEEELEPPMDEAGRLLEVYYSVLRLLASEVHVQLCAMWYPIPADSPFLFSDGIMDIVPRHLCAGETLVILGQGFGQPQPDRIHLVLPCEIEGERPEGVPRRAARIAPVPDAPQGSWTDTEIRLPCPKWARSGPVGFLDEQALDVYREMAQWAGDAFWPGGTPPATPSLDPIEAGAWYLGRSHPTVVTTPEPVFPCPPATDHNQFWGTVPEITVSPGEDGHLVMAPNGEGSEQTLQWHVVGATPGTEPSIKIYHRYFAPVGIHWDWVEVLLEEHEGGQEVSGFLQLSFNQDHDEEHYYRFEATNECGLAETETAVHLRKPTVVTLYAIEVTQAIQNFEKDEPSLNNAIPLVEGKQTIVRVYAGSGKSGSLGHVTANVKLTALSEQGHPNSFPWSWSYSSWPQEDELPPNDRVEHQAPKLQTPIPIEATTGIVRVRVRLESTDQWAAWEPVEATTDAEFEPTAGLDLAIFRVLDKFGNLTSPEEIDDSLEKLRAIFPVPYEDGIRYWIEGTIHATELDLNSDHDWYAYSPDTDLFDLLDEAAQELPEGVIPCAIVAVESRDKAEGRGWPGGLGKERLAYWRSDLGGHSFIEAHELGHAMNLKDNDGRTRIQGVDLRDPYSPLPKGPNTRQMMKKYKDVRWINPSEYLWLIKWMEGGAGSVQMAMGVFDFCLDHDLHSDLSVFFVP